MTKKYILELTDNEARFLEEVLLRGVTEISNKIKPGLEEGRSLQEIESIYHLDFDGAKSLSSMTIDDWDRIHGKLVSSVADIHNSVKEW